MKVDQAKEGLAVSPCESFASQPLQSIGTVVHLDESILIVATLEMALMYEWELIEECKDSGKCCNLGAVHLASST